MVFYDYFKNKLCFHVLKAYKERLIEEKSEKQEVAHKDQWYLIISWLENETKNVISYYV